MIVSNHARLQYKNRVDLINSDSWGRDYANRRVLEHLECCRLASDVEMTYIRRSKGIHNITDKGNVKHYIDPESLMVFVIGYDDEPIVITCYCAPYLSRAIEFDRKSVERDRIIDIFREAGGTRSPMKWSVALWLLSEAGFNVSNGPSAKGFEVEEFPTGLAVFGYSLVSKRRRRKRKRLSDSCFKSFRWVDNFVWCFFDFGIESPDEFIEEYGC